MDSLIRRIKGFTLIELVFFIILSAILASAIMVAANTALLGSPAIGSQLTSNMLAQSCMERVFGQRRLNGWTPCTVTTTCPTLAGYTITRAGTALTLNGDTSYCYITVTVTGPQKSNAKLALLIGAY